jgi:hypothetical protein
MAFWPASVPPDKRRPVQEVSAESLRRTVLGARRLVWWWPGLVVVALAYTAVAMALFDHSYPNLWGGIAAAAVGTAWYGSPLRRLEARRRERLRASSSLLSAERRGSA